MGKATVKVENSNVRSGKNKQVDEKVRANKKRAQKLKFVQGVRCKHWDGNIEISSLLWKGWKLVINGLLLSMYALDDRSVP